MQQMNRERFYEQVRHYRAPTGKTQQDLAKVLALNPQVLSHKLHGVRNAHLTHREVQTIVKTLVERQGGLVGLESSPGQGASFWFSLPAAVATSAAESDVPSERSPA